MYAELDLDFLGIVVPKVGILITQDPSELLDEHHKTQLPGVIGWNLLAYQVFAQKHGLLSLEHYNCPTGISLLLFLQHCVFHHNKAGGIQLGSVTLNTLDSSSYLKKTKVSINEDGLLGKVWIGNINQPTCVPGNSALTIPGRLGKNTRIPSGTPCLIDRAAVNNLPQEFLLTSALHILKAIWCQ